MKLFQFALAVLLLVVSACLYAGKPVKDQEINTGPVRSGNVLSCDVSNLTDTAITAGITIYYVDNTFQTTESSYIEVLIDPNSVRRNSVPEVHRGGYCKITWQGEYGELRGTACSLFAADPDVYRFYGCSDAY